MRYRYLNCRTHTITPIRLDYYSFNLNVRSKYSFEFILNRFMAYELE